MQRILDEMFSSGSKSMDELIKSLRRQDEIAAIARDTENRMRLHDAEVIHAKASDFWNLTFDYLQVLCSGLVEAFPTNYNRHAVIQGTANGFFLNGGGLPRRILSAEFDIKGQRVRLSVRVKHSFEDQPAPQVLPSIDIKVGSEEEVRFHYMGKPHDDPQDLARALPCYVCGIHASNSAKSHT